MGPKGIEESLSPPYTIPKVIHKDLTFLESGNDRFFSKLFLNRKKS
jgi:hypothetical protein